MDSRLRCCCSLRSHRFYCGLWLLQRTWVCVNPLSSWRARCRFLSHFVTFDPGVRQRRRVSNTAVRSTVVSPFGEARRCVCHVCWILWKYMEVRNSLNMFVESKIQWWLLCGWHCSAHAQSIPKQDSILTLISIIYKLWYCFIEWVKKQHWQHGLRVWPGDQSGRSTWEGSRDDRAQAGGETEASLNLGQRPRGSHCWLTHWKFYEYIMKVVDVCWCLLPSFCLMRHHLYSFVVKVKLWILGRTFTIRRGPRWVAAVPEERWGRL